MAKTFFEKFLTDKESQRIYQQEGLIVDFAEMVHELMEKKGVKKKDVAKELGVSASQVTQWLDGAANLQLRTISDILFALDSKLKMEAEPLREILKLIGKNAKPKNTGWTSLHGQFGSGIPIRLAETEYNAA
ncbi:MAG TPA: helix-turn-helix transcriptional regulator [Planctomycetes bacterium]|nr:helix-turn-helix transcriptional regulator [Planctomycetota bacterium]